MLPSGGVLAGREREPAVGDGGLRSGGVSMAHEAPAPEREKSALAQPVTRAEFYVVLALATGARFAAPVAVAVLDHLP